MVWHYVKLAWYWWFPVKDEICELTPLLEVDYEKNSPVKKKANGTKLSGPVQPFALRDRGDGLLLGNTSGTLLPCPRHVRGRRKYRGRNEFINKTLTWWPGGKPRADSIKNIMGDNLAAIAGYYCAYKLDDMGKKKKWVYGV